MFGAQFERFARVETVAEAIAVAGLAAALAWRKTRFEPRFGAPPGLHHSNLACCGNLRGADGVWARAGNDGLKLGLGTGLHWFLGEEGNRIKVGIFVYICQFKRT